MRKAVVILVTLAALVPSAVSGAPAAQPATLFVDPFLYKGYKWTLVVTDGAKDSLMIMATKQRGKAVQSHVYTFQQGVSFTANAALSSAKLVAKLGKYGVVNMTFTGRGALAVSAPPPPCTGVKYQSKRGTLAGKPGLAFQADTSFFGKITKPSLAAHLSRQLGAGKLDCSGGASTVPTQPTPGTTSLTGFSTTGGERLMFAAQKTAAGAVTESAILFEDAAQSAPASVFHSTAAPAAANAFTVADDLSTATVTAVSPSFTGTLTFTSAGAAGKMASGTLAGNFTAQFDSAGPRTFDDLQATLFKG